MSQARPDIFAYHDYRVFLRDWFAFRKANQPGFSLRQLAKASGLAVGYLPMILSGKRVLSGSGLAKLMPHLALQPREQSFLENLLVLGTSDSHEARTNALERMKRFPRYQVVNPNDHQVYEYLTHWYYVAIRELASTPIFNADPVWIQDHLRFGVSLKEVKDALEFLLKHGYIERTADGKIRPPEKAIDCSGGIYRLALGNFHREIFALAGDSIEKTASKDRNIQGHTCALNAADFERAQKIVEQAMQEIRDLGEHSEKGESVYHMEVALFPLTKPSEKDKAS